MRGDRVERRTQHHRKVLLRVPHNGLESHQDSQTVESFREVKGVGIGVLGSQEF